MPHQSEMFTLKRGRAPIITITATPTLISDLIRAADPTIDLGKNLENVISFIIEGKQSDGSDRLAIQAGFDPAEMNLFRGDGVADDTPVRGDRYVQQFGGSPVPATVLIGFE